MKISTTKKYIKKALIILFWLIVWEGAAFIARNEIVLVGPIEVVKALMVNLGTLEFYQNVAGSLGRIGLGFTAAFFAGIFIGTLGYKFKIIEEFLSPVVNAIKSVPVASFVVLLLIWAGSKNLAFYICLLIVFPNIYISCIEGLRSTELKMLEMADAYEFGFAKKVVFIYKYSLLPYLRSSLKVSLGMAWKSGVAAEVIGLPVNSIGGRIYTSKIYLDTADLFAWTLTVILLSFVTEKIVLALVSLWGNKMSKPVIKRTFGGYDCKDLILKDISVSFGELEVIKDFDIELKKNGIYIVMGPSGCGKTTLLKEIYTRSDMVKSIMFQENRLVENADAITNICLGSNDLNKNEIVLLAKKLLPEDQLYNKVSTYSGGMQRRVALLRALARKADLIILDEPFTGLDESNICSATKLIKEVGANSTVVIVSHDEEDSQRLGGEIIWMKE